jgi:hypothetical protein
MAQQNITECRNAKPVTQMTQMTVFPITISVDQKLMAGESVPNHRHYRHHRHPA